MEDVKDNELDKLIRKCYQCMSKSDINDIFVVYEDSDEIIEIVYDIKKRVLAVDKVISYFENLEEYEICHKLVQIKERAN